MAEFERNVIPDIVREKLFGALYVAPPDKVISILECLLEYPELYEGIGKDMEHIGYLLSSPEILIIFCARGWAEVVEMLLDYGADPLGYLESEEFDPDNAEIVELLESKLPGY